jgi:tRNA(Arg) A34 adenosine deaminase TadA
MHTSVHIWMLHISPRNVSVSLHHLQGARYANFKINRQRTGHFFIWFYIYTTVISPTEPIEMCYDPTFIRQWYHQRNLSKRAMILHLYDSDITNGTYRNVLWFYIYTTVISPTEPIEMCYDSTFMRQWYHQLNLSKRALILHLYDSDITNGTYRNVLWFYIYATVISPTEPIEMCYDSTFIRLWYHQRNPSKCGTI